MGCCQDKTIDKDLILFDINSHLLLTSKKTRDSFILNSKCIQANDLEKNPFKPEKFKQNKSNIIKEQSIPSHLLTPDSSAHKPMRHNSFSYSPCIMVSKGHLNRILLDNSDDQINKSQDEPSPEHKRIRYSKYLHVFQEEEKPLNSKHGKKRRLTQNNLLRDYHSKANKVKGKVKGIDDGDLANFGFDVLITK